MQEGWAKADDGIVQQLQLELNDLRVELAACKKDHDIDVQTLRQERDHLSAELKEVRAICGDRYPDARMLETVHQLRAEVNNLLLQVQTYKDAEIKNYLARSETLALKWMNECLNLRAEVERLKITPSGFDKLETMQAVEEFDKFKKGNQ